MKRFFNILLVAIMVVGLSYAVVEIQAAFSTITSGPVKNSGYLTQYLREARGSKLIYATAGTATVGSPTVATTMTGIEAGDVIHDIINLGASAGTISASNLTNINEAIYTIAAGEAYLNTSTGAPTVGDNLVILFTDMDNTR